MSFFNNKLMDIVRADRRYAYEAYEFVFQSLEHTQKMLGRTLDMTTVDPSERRNHVSCRQLLDGARELAIREFGLMARVVLRRWGITRTDDFGEIVFNLIEAELMSKTDEDARTDFRGVFDLDESLSQGFQIVLEDE
ncbi:MAG: hypothetical protein EXS16_14070 [Gemmataceae bacterium]|nr:hypothetical protein [Gemmataceae bacterium]